jgi:hypothetical protein
MLMPEPFHVPRHAVEQAGAQSGVLFALGDPVELRWYREGRAATPAETWESVATGLPALRAMARQEGTGAVLALEAQIDRFVDLVPVLRDVERDLEEG